MRVATAAQMALIDRDTIAGGVTGLELMESAGREIVRHLLDLFPELAPPGRLVICCGKGNNGGDGLVMARLLDALGFRVSVMLLGLPEDLSADARHNHGRLPAGVEVFTWPKDEWADRLDELAEGADLVIDAIFGTGVKLPVREPYAALLRAFNELMLPVVSVDVPSGVCGDTGGVDPTAVRADATVTVGLPKLGLILAPGRDFTGRLSIVDIGFPADICERHTPRLHFLEPDEYAMMLPVRPSDIHKYRGGTVLVVAGSRAFGGAAVLAGLGALRSGAGLIKVAVPACLEIPTRVGLPEALVAALPETPNGTLAPVEADVWDALLQRQHAVAFGPGLGADEGTDRLAVELCRRLPLPLVVDADGISAFGRLRAEPSFVSSAAVLTPHAGELSRVVGRPAAEIEANRLELAPELASRWGVTLMLKGSPTLIASAGGEVFLNPVGDDALAHGGSGDVLTGLVGGLLAQGCDGLTAALLGAWLHGRAGQIASATISRRSVLAREVADGLGDAFADLEAMLPLEPDLPADRSGPDPGAGHVTDGSDRP